MWKFDQAEFKFGQILKMKFKLSSSSGKMLIFSRVSSLELLDQALIKTDAQGYFIMLFC